MFIISTGKFWVTSGSIFGFHKKGFDKIVFNCYSRFFNHYF
ncbi:hypothetical protein BSPLISOX_3199 [uncultured Gammaproteobacteria bacterium]|nr:hypothetical protein [uncultured Gammaproteobacteria bacterium]VVH66230.1 hypothetical protein BSPLISOX_3195 [uncultured Gammaproteobacteria bacterium]VVH66234.1 hypothetical protein BSPLISOX_3199 [uncultured Gammaproteobacteria bacterium]